SGGGSTSTLHPVAGKPETFFDAAFYLAHNPDVASAIAKGLLPDAWTHFRLYGKFEGRQPSALFNESFYLAHNPDVAFAVAMHILPTGFDHYVLFGYAEPRQAV